MLELEPLDATFGAIVRGVELRALDDATWRGAPRGVARARPADLPRPVPHPRRAGRLRPALRRAGVRRRRPSRTSARDGKVHSEPDDDRVKGAAGQRGLAPRQHLHAGAGQGRRVHAPRSCRARARPPAGPTCGRPTRRSTTRPAHAGRRPVGLPLAVLQPGPGRLPAAKKNDKGGYNGYGYHDGEVPLRPLVKVHPDTGRPNLLIGRHAYGIVGMDPDESERFLDRLADEACQAAPHLPPPVGGGRRRHLGQPPAHAPGHAVRHDPAPAHVAHPHRRRPPVRAGHQLRLSAHRRR